MAIQFKIRSNIVITLVGFMAAVCQAAVITTAHQPGQLDIRCAGEHSIRVTLRPLADEEALPFSPALGDQYLWGRDLLIAPVFKPGAQTRDVYLPQGTWIDWWTLETYTGGLTLSRRVNLSKMPIYVRAGAIIPFDPIRQYTAQPVDDPTTLKIFTGADGQFTLYEDDGISLDYLRGHYTKTKITWNDHRRQLTLEPIHSQETGPHPFRIELLPTGITREILYTGKFLNVSLNQ